MAAAVALCGLGPPGATLAQSSTAQTDDQTVRVRSFDCVADQGGPITEMDFADSGISRWHGGGPGGAAVNVGRLQCRAVYKTSCTSGEVLADFYVANALVGTVRRLVELTGKRDLQLAVARRQWVAHYDQPGPAGAGLPYQTATFSVRLVLTCREPFSVGPSFGPRRDFTDDAHFTAGFVEGE